MGRAGRDGGPACAARCRVRLDPPRHRRHLGRSRRRGGGPRVRQQRDQRRLRAERAPDSRVGRRRARRPLGRQPGPRLPRQPVDRRAR